MYFFIAKSNPFFEAYSQSDLFGKFIFLTLLALSLLSWTLSIYKLLLLKQIEANARYFSEAFQKKRHLPLNLEVSSKEKFQPFAEIYRTLKFHTLELLNKNRALTDGDGEKVYLSLSDIELVGGHINSCIGKQIVEIEKNLFLLSTTVTLAPFLGLLGTVWGILISLSQLGSKAASSGSDAVLSGLAMALGTTVLGLLVAIPAILAYNFFKNRVREFQAQLEAFSTEALASIEIHYRKVDLA